ncbi:SRR1-like protein [Protopterus annectens]|uniref:SRR1-like protein n=1 Tax=Protopterus annectens TaxID=7888 RepID=UPI001CFC3D6E|nr:SRR1-like protein [Protopterus annectens]
MVPSPRNIGRISAGYLLRPSDSSTMFGLLAGFPVGVGVRQSSAVSPLLFKLISEEKCHIYDPVFTEMEINLLKEFGLNVLCENEEGKHEVQNPTLFYMIHCGKALYNNLLWRNWLPESLAKMVIIGNSFQSIEQRLVARILQKDYTYIAKILQFTEEVPLPSSTRYLDVFNDTSVHWFPYKKLMDYPRTFWDSPAEPSYEHIEDLEIIRTKK